jgi:molybdenum cofactor cytidylyltransferase
MWNALHSDARGREDLVIAGIVLAAGQAKRMGRPKQLLSFRGETLLGTTLAIAATALDNVVVVLGAAAETIAAQVDLHGTEAVINPDYATGQASSLLVGLQAMAAKSDVTAVVVLLGDQPTVRGEVITTLCDYHLAHPDVATVVPCYGTRRGNPVLFAQSAWPLLVTSITGDEGARQLIARGEPAPLIDISFPEVWRPQDIDTWDDYRGLA